MNVFELRQRLVDDYADFTRSFVDIRDERIAEHVDRELERGAPLAGADRPAEPGVRARRHGRRARRRGLLARRAARRSSGAARPPPTRVGAAAAAAPPPGRGDRGRPHGRELRPDDRHRLGQEPRLHRPDRRPRAPRRLGQRDPGDRRLPDERAREQPGGRAREVPRRRPPGSTGPVTFGRYTGQESDEERQEILARPPDILLTNYVMLELHPHAPLRAATSSRRRRACGSSCSTSSTPTAVARAPTSRCSSGASARRARRPSLQCVGTSATLAGAGTLDEQRAEVARVATLLFGATVEPRT